MSTKDAVTQINGAVTAAIGEAAGAYDALVTELNKEAPDGKVIARQAGTIWTSSVRAWANLVLAPGKLAEAFTSGS